MANKTYSEKLKSPLWQRRRLEVMERDQFTCVLCGDKDTTLNIHHLKYTGEPWEAPDSDLHTYCSDCHTIVEKNKKQGLAVDRLIKKKMVNNEMGARLYFIKMVDDPGLYMCSINPGSDHLNFDIRLGQNTIMQLLTLM